MHRQMGLYSDVQYSPLREDQNIFLHHFSPLIHFLYLLLIFVNKESTQSKQIEKTQLSLSDKIGQLICDRFCLPIMSFSPDHWEYFQV